MDSAVPNQKIPPWMKIIAVCYLAVFIPVYWWHLGVANFLWFSDIALIVTVFSLLRESRYPISMMAVGVLMFELGWNLDFFSRLLLGKHILGIGFTAGMFTDEFPLIIRLISISFHVLLPWVLVYLIARLGYDKDAWKGQTILGWVVMPICYRLTEPAQNINWVYGLVEQQTIISGPLFVLLEMLLLPVIVYYPTHRVIYYFVVKVKQ